jgi:uncharacterized Zn finger protein (UPF0148 family)
MEQSKKLVNQLNCDNCGGPLNPRLGEQLIICPYCKSTQHLNIDWKKDDKDETKLYTVPQDAPKVQSFPEHSSSADLKQVARKIIRIIFLIFFFIILFIILYQILRMTLFDSFSGGFRGF